LRMLNIGRDSSFFDDYRLKKKLKEMVKTLSPVHNAVDRNFFIFFTILPFKKKTRMLIFEGKIIFALTTFDILELIENKMNI